MGEVSLIILYCESMLKCKCAVKFFAVLDIYLIISISNTCSCSLPALASFLGKNQGFHAAIIKRPAFILILD